MKSPDRRALRLFCVHFLINELNYNRDVKPLYFSDRLDKRRVCIETGKAESGGCDARDEWFIAGTYPSKNKVTPTTGIRIKKPGKGLMMAMDPRIPDEYEYFEFKLTDIGNIKKVDWFVNDRLVGTTDTNVYQWKLAKGDFVGKAEVWLKGKDVPVVTETVAYKVN